MKFEEFLKYVQPYSMTGNERIKFLYDSLNYISENNVPGDFVECGVWKGGNIIGIMKYLEYYKRTDNIWLYDTFSGMTEPESNDIDLYGRNSIDIINEPLVKATCSLEDVKENITKFKDSYPTDNLKYVVGDITQTLLDEKNTPEKISLLRLDTDWYKSTKIELEILFDKLSSGGVLIIDDYGHWNGCREAVDEFFKDKNYEFTKIDYTGISIIK